MKLNRTGANWDRRERNDINENWDIIEGEYNEVVDRVSDKAFDKVVDSARINWGEPVDSFGDLPSSADEGETRMARDTGKVYRFDGDTWVEIQDIDPTAINEVDSRLNQKIVDKHNETMTQLADKARQVTPFLFGAKGDGITDDRLALVDTINYAIENNCVVNLLSGYTFLIDSKDESLDGADLTIFEITGRLEIVGTSTIKIGSIGDYEAVFRIRENASGSSFKGFTLDENTNENPTTENEALSLRDHLGKRRIAFYGYNPTFINNLTFENLTIKNCIGVWQIQARAHNVKIERIIVEYEKTNGGVNPKYDRTCIFMAGNGWTLRDSIFNGSELTSTCIETHGRNQTIDNNKLYNFNSMLYITNEIYDDSTSIGTINIVNNTFNSRKGMRLWFTKENIDADYINIANNNLYTTDVDNGVISTKRDNAKNVVINEVDIFNNRIGLDSSETPFVSLYNSVVSDSGGETFFRRFTIKDNEFFGVCKALIDFRVQMSKNQVFNDVLVVNNTFDVDLKGDRLFYLVDPPFGFKNIRIKNNIFKITANGNFQVLKPFTNTRDIGYGAIKLIKNNYNVIVGEMINISEPEGQIVLEVYEDSLDDISVVDKGFDADRLIYKGVVEDKKGQYMRVENKRPVHQIRYSESQPSQGRYLPGDIVYSTDPLTSLCVGWICIGEGSPGSWRSFGEIEV